MSTSTFASDRYRVERELGGGAMARVLLAHDAELGRPVAVKILEEPLASDDAFRARFAREARLAASLSHPNVVTIYDVGETDGKPYIVMEYVPGRTLEDRLQEGPLPPDEVRRIARDVCAGLEHAHASGLVHRDLKPGNLIAHRDGVVKIADFGIASAAEETQLTEAGTILGTAAYLAPEQALGGEIGPETDLYTLGIVLYELATGRRPWQVHTLADLGRRLSAPPPVLPESLPADLGAAIARCLEPDPLDRPGSAGEVARMLDGGDETATVVLRRARGSTRARPAARRSRAGLWIPIGLTVAALGLGGLALALGIADTGEPPPPEEPAVQPVPRGETPAEDARNLAQWLRENAREPAP